MTERTLRQVIPGTETSDGAGVRIKRSLGQQQNVRLDPFLMLDEFGSDQPQDYICLLYTSPSPRDQRGSRMPSSA